MWSMRCCQTYPQTVLLGLVAAQTLPLGPAVNVRSGFASEELKEASPILLQAPSAARIWKKTMFNSLHFKRKRFYFWERFKKYNLPVLNSSFAGGVSKHL